MPYAIKEMAGKPYVPSNGSEGRAFMARFCEHCIRDTEQSCPILFNALDSYAKLTRRVEALKGEHDIVDVGAPGEHPSQGPNWAMQATTFIEEPM
jgi:hypothetical protein